MRRTYSPEEHEIMLEMWNEGATLTQIGDRLGKTRSSVAGQINRLRGKGMEFKVRTAVGPRGRDLEEPIVPRSVQTYSADPPLTGKCKWPADDVLGWTACDKNRIEGSPYCEKHHKRAHIPGTGARRVY